MTRTREREETMKKKSMLKSMLAMLICITMVMPQMSVFATAETGVLTDVKTTTDASDTVNEETPPGDNANGDDDEVVDLTKPIATPLPTDEPSEVVVPEGESGAMGDGLSGGASTFAAGDIEVTASSAQATSYATYTNPATSLAPAPLRVSLTVDIKQGGTTGMYIEIPHNFDPPSSFEFKPFAAPAPEEQFFTFDEMSSTAGTGYAALVDSLDTSDPSKLRINLKDGLPTGQATLNLYYDFNMNYDAIVPAGTVVGKIEAKVFEGTGTLVYADNALEIKTPTNNTGSRMFVGYMNRNVPTTDEYASGEVVVGLNWSNRNPLQAKIDPTYESIIYLDVPDGWTISTISATTYLNQSVAIAGGTRYYRIVGGPTVTDESAQWNRWDYNGVIGDCMTVMGVSLLPPTSLAIEDEFEFAMGLKYKKVNGQVIEDERILAYTKVAEKAWEMSMGSLHAPRVEGTRVFSELSPNSVATMDMTTGWGYVGGDTIKNMGSEDITGVRKELYQTSAGSPKPNFRNFRIVLSYDTSKIQSKYKVIFDITDDTNTRQVIRGVDEVTPGVDVLLPTLSQGEYISKITAVPMGTDGTKEGHLPSGNAFMVQYRHKAWDSETWPDGTPVDRAVIQMEWTLYYDDEDGDPQTQVSRVTQSQLYYGTSDSVGAKANMLSSVAPAGVNPGAMVSYDILGYNDSGEATADWKNPTVSIKVPKFMELQGSTFSLIDRQTGSDVTMPGNVFVNAQSDATHNYYQFRYTHVTDYTVSPAAVTAVRFAIPVTFKIADGTVPGTTALDTLVVSSRDTFSFKQMIQPMNNLSAPAAALYGFGAGDNYSQPSGVVANSSILINSNAHIATSSQVKSEGTDNAWIPAGGAAVPAKYEEEVEMKTSIINAGNSIYDNVKVFNILPTNGDAYGSTGSIAFESVAASGATVYYTTNAPTSIGLTYASPINTYNPASFPAIWSTSKPASGITAIFVVYPPTSTINPLDSFDIGLTFKVPTEASVGGAPQTAYNEFRYSASEQGTSNVLNATSARAGFSTAATLIAFEENKPSTLGYLTDVTFMPPNQSSIVGGMAISVPAATPMLYGYTFSGWNTSADGLGSAISVGHIWDPSSAPLTLSLYAQWEPKDITVSFDANTGSGSAPMDKTIQFGKAISSSDIPVNTFTKQGYDFAGWGTTNSTTTPDYVAGYSTISENSVTVYAIWTPRTDTPYVVNHWQKNVGTTTYTQVTTDTLNATGTTGSVVPAADYAPKSYPGFTYDKTEPSGAKIITGDGSLVIDVYYNRAIHEVRYEYEGVVPSGATSLPASINVEQGVTVNVPAITATGYTFSGWAASGVTIISDEFTMPDNDVVLKGSFSAASTGYSVEHYLQNIDGTYPVLPASTENKSGTTGDTINPATLANAPIGFTYDSATPASPVISADGSLVIKLEYTRNSYDVKYEISGTTPPGMTTLPVDATIKYGQSVTIAGNVSASGYTFNGWSQAGSPVAAGSTFTMPNNAVLITGSFTANSNTAYTIRHWQRDLSPATTYTEVTADTLNETGTTGTIVPAMMYAPKTYQGFTHTSTTPAGVKTIKGDGSLEIDVYYERNTYNVTYAYTNTAIGASTLPIGETNVEHGAVVTTKPDASADGYTFTGWSINGTAIASTFVMPIGHTTIEGGFTANGDTAYTIEHYTEDLSGGGYTLVDTQSEDGETESEVAYIAQPLTGFTYDDTQDTWNYGSLKPVIKGDGSLVIKLYYTRNSYDVKYEIDGVMPNGMSPLPVDETIKYEESVTLKPDVSAPGYDFNGWETSDVTIANDEFDMPAIDVIIKGDFSARTDTPYTVIHKVKDVGVDTYTVLETQVLTGITDVIADFAKKTPVGFTFDDTKTLWGDGTSMIGRSARSMSYGNTNPEIAGDGTLVVELYYSRNTYLVNY